MSNCCAEIGKRHRSNRRTLGSKFSLFLPVFSSLENRTRVEEVRGTGQQLPNDLSDQTVAIKSGRMRAFLWLLLSLFSMLS